MIGIQKELVTAVFLWALLASGCGPGHALPTSAPTAAPTETSTSLPSVTPSRAATLTPTPLPAEITDSKSAEMVLVPAGEFIMGSKKYPDTKPVNNVYLDTYYFDRYEVTNKLYRACVDAGACEPPLAGRASSHTYYDGNGFDSFPVIDVDWSMAKSLCEWRGARLPTEAEWEKAARGTDGRTYPWGENMSCSNANSFGCTPDTTAVGTYENGKSVYGIFDTAGNVAEWVADWYSPTYYSISPTSNPLGPPRGAYHVARGSSWPRYTLTENLNLAWRNPYLGFGDRGGEMIGIRCAAPASATPAVACRPGNTIQGTTNDSIQFGYIDISKVDTSIDGTRLTVVFSLRELPSEITINQKGLKEGAPEIAWGVAVDVDNDPATGGSMFGLGHGQEAVLQAFHFKQPGEAQTGAIDKLFIDKTKTWELTSDGGGKTVSDGTISVDSQAGTITLSGDVPNISPDSYLYFYAFYLDPKAQTSPPITDDLCRRP